MDEEEKTRRGNCSIEILQAQTSACQTLLRDVNSLANVRATDGTRGQLLRALTAESRVLARFEQGVRRQVGAEDAVLFVDDDLAQ